MPKTALEMLVAANPADAERWSALVSHSPASDVYYLPAYALATSEIERSEPVAIVAGQDSCRFLAPFLIRNMSAGVNGFRIGWSDASSPYGYGGLLCLSGSQPPNADDIRHFLDDLHSWCSTHNIVCCVLRLHPLMRQAEWFLPPEQWPDQWQKHLRVHLRGATTAIDITHWDEAQDRPHGLRKGRRSDLNLARRMLRITWANVTQANVTQTTGEDPNAVSSLDRFLALYEQTMEDHRAEDFYKFPPSYFSRLASLGHHLGIAFAWLDDQLAGASIFLSGRDYAHYHLAAGNELGMKYKAATLLIVEGAKWARARGCKLLHLGGGLGPGDSLEDFKSSFGGESYHYAYLTYIADLERFEQLCQLPDAPWPYRVSEKPVSL